MRMSQSGVEGNRGCRFHMDSLALSYKLDGPVRGELGQVRRGSLSVYDRLPPIQTKNATIRCKRRDAETPEEDRE